MGDRANYALQTNTFGEEHYLQISCDDVILATVFKEDHQTYVVHNGDGCDENGDELPFERAVKSVNFTIYNQLERWQEMVRFAYLHVLGKMFKVDRELAEEI